MFIGEGWNANGAKEVYHDDDEDEINHDDDEESNHDDEEIDHDDVINRDDEINYEDYDTSSSIGAYDDEWDMDYNYPEF